MIKFDMLHNHFKTTWRHLLNNKQFTLLNLIGLTSGFTSALLIGLWVTDEFAFDKFHEKDSRLYEVMIHEKSGNRIATSNSTGELLGETILNTMPEAETSVFTTPASWFQKFSLSKGSATISAGGNFVSKDYFNAFSLPLVQGDEDKALANRKSIVVSEELATRLFRSPEYAMGKILEWEWQAYSEKCLVTGVFKSYPANSFQHYDFLLSMDAWNQIVPPGNIRASSGPFNNFIVLKEGADINAVNKKMSTLAKTSFNDSTSQLCSIATVIAIATTRVLLPAFNGMTGKSLNLHFDYSTIMILLAAALLAGLLAGGYPAFYLSRFNPAFSLKGRLAGSFNELLTRKGLVVFQFTVSVIFIVSVFIIYQQILHS